MTTRPGYTWDDTNDEWVQIGPGVVESPVYYQATEPVSAPTGALWVESDVDVPVSYANQYRWQYTATGGETSLSGGGLTYSPGYEQLFLNGILLVRGQDYVATTGTTITGLLALTAGDAIELLSIGTYPVADTYTQNQSDARFVNKGNNGLTMIVPTAATNATISPNGAVNIGSGVTSVAVSNAFSSAYDMYKITLTGGVGSTTSNFYLQLSGITSGYSSNLNYRSFANTSNNVANATGQSVWFWIGGQSTSGQQMSVELTNPFTTKPKFVVGTHYNINGAGDVGSGIGYNNSTASATGFTISAESGTITGGTIRIYGYNNGA